MVEFNLYCVKCTLQSAELDPSDAEDFHILWAAVLYDGSSYCFAHFREVAAENYVLKN